MNDVSTRIPSPGEGKRGEAGYVGYLLRQAAHAYENRVARLLADLDVTPPQFSVLTMIAAYPGLSNADIARLALLTPQTVGVIIGNLERGGHVARRAHPVHGRIKQVDLTDQGRALLDAARARVHALEEDLLRAAGGSQAEPVVRRWLAAVAETMSGPPAD